MWYDGVIYMALFQRKNSAIALINKFCVANAAPATSRLLYLAFMLSFFIKLDGPNTDLFTVR